MVKQGYNSNFFFFCMRYLVVPTHFVKRRQFSLLNCLDILVENNLAKNVRIYFWTLFYSIMYSYGLYEVLYVHIFVCKYMCMCINAHIEVKIKVNLVVIEVFLLALK